MVFPSIVWIIFNYKWKQGLSVCMNVNVTLLICHKIIVNIILNNLKLFWIVLLNGMRKRSITSLSLMNQVKFHSYLIFFVFHNPSCKTLHLHLCSWQMLKSKVTCIAFSVYIFSVHVQHQWIFNVKGVVHPKSVIFHPHVIPNLYDLLSSVKHTHTHIYSIYIWKYVSVFSVSSIQCCWLLLYGQKKVQNIIRII